MFSKLVLRRKKTIAALAAVMAVGSAFETGGCTVNVDQAMLQQLVDSLSGSFEFNFNQGPPFGHGPDDDGSEELPEDGGTDGL